MAITSTNHNPSNASTYARHRSIFKGGANKLQDAVREMQAVRGLNCYEYLGRDAEMQFRNAWATYISASRKMGIIGRHWVVTSPWPQGLHDALPGELRGDFRLIWRDFNIVAQARILRGEEASDYSGQQLIFMAYNRNRFDLIFSKWGYGETTRKHHNFFHWQARAQGVQDAIAVDDYRLVA